MAVLVYLASHRGEVVTRAELEDYVWAGTVVGYDALGNTIIKLRKAFGDKARDPHVIETISKTGYRLLAPVTDSPRETSADSEAEQPTRPQPPADRTEHLPRKLAAILYADVAGYSRLTGEDEDATHRRLSEYLDLVATTVAHHQGRVMHYAGDAVLAMFDAVLDAVGCAVQIQHRLKIRNAELPHSRKVAFRIGVNLGDVIEDRGDIYGDGVNVAARLESLAEAGGICVSEAVRTALGNKLALDFEPLGEQRVKNIAEPVRAYRLSSDAGTRWARPGAATLHMAAPRLSRRSLTIGLVALTLVAGALGWYLSNGLRTDPALALPTGPAIAVIPFANDGTARDAYFSDGITEDIISELSRFSSLFVIASHSTARFKDKAGNCREIARVLGARYILKGVVRRSANHLRVTARLLDGKACTRLWSEKYDRDFTATDVFAVQDDIAARVVGSIGSSEAPLWNSRIQKENRDKRTTSLEAYDCVLLSYWFYETFAADAHKRAKDCLRRAVKIDPSYALAWSRLAFMYIEEKKYGYNAEPRPLERALRAARKAVSLDPRNPDGFYALAMVYYMTEADFDAFQSFAEKAISLNPNDAWVLADLGTWTAYSGEWTRGLALVEKAKKLNPLHQRWLDYAPFLHHYLKREYRQAKALALKINLPDNYMVQASLAATYAQLGEIERAKQTLDHVLAIRPSYASDPRAPFRTRRMPPALIESLMDGLGKAGLTIPAEG